MPRRLTVTIRPDGSIAAEASGTPGPDCLDALEQLRTMLHAEIDSSKPTPEFSFQAAPVDLHVSAEDYLEDRA